MKKLKNNLLYFIQVAKIRLVAEMQYKGWFYAKYASTFVTIIIMYYFWLAISKSANSNIMGYSDKYALTTYIIMATLISKIGSGALPFVNEVRTGNFSIHFVKPYNLFIQDAFASFVKVLYDAIIVSMPIYIFALLFLNLTPPSSISSFIGYIILVISSAAVMITFEIFFGMFVVLITNAWGFIQLKNFLTMFFSGLIMPITLFPDILQTIANYLPFKTVVYMPVSYYINPSNEQLFNTLFLQATWFITFSILSCISWSLFIKKRVVIMGG